MIYAIIAAAVAVIAVVALWAVLTSNSLIVKRNRIRQCRSGIDIVLKQRNDLIPNLVAAVKTYMGYENELLARIAEIRSRAEHEPESESLKSGAELSQLLSRLNLAVESYPELKADSQFLALQGQIVEMELELQAIRRTYNAAVVDYNNAVEMFPSSVIASLRHHTPEMLIAIPASDTGAVDVARLFDK